MLRLTPLYKYDPVPTPPSGGAFVARCARSGRRLQSIGNIFWWGLGRLENHLELRCVYAALSSYKSAGCCYGLRRYTNMTPPQPLPREGPLSRARRAPEGGCKLFIIFEHVSALDFSDFDCAEDTFARQNANKFAFALAYLYLCTLYYSYEIRTRTYALRQSRPCGCAAHRPRGGAYADIHARGYGGRNEGDIPPRPEKRGAGAHNTRQYLPPLPASRHGDNRARRRRAPFLDVERPDADRQRRLSGLFAGRMPQTQRGGLPLPLAYRRVASSVHARERHRHRAHHRRRHHDGVR